MKLGIISVAAATLCAALSAPALAHEGAVRADGHAPIGVMGDHMHKMGEVMLSYRYMHMAMEGNRVGTDSLSTSQVVGLPSPFGPGNIRVVPTEMTMEMHMVGAMYAPTDNLTLMAMGSYIVKEMDHQSFGAGGYFGSFKTSSEGVGDTKLSGLIRLYDDGVHHLHLNAGISLPTGSITETDFTRPVNGVRRLPYAMQLGSGTFDLLPGITYSGKLEQVAWGGQMSGVIRLGENDENYALGDEFHATAWASYMPQPWISFSGRLIGSSKGEIDGQDSQIALPVSTADPANYGGRTIEAGLGINLAGQTGWLRGHRIAAEYVVPVYRDLNGPQMETDWMLTLGYQYAF